MTLIIQKEKEKMFDKKLLIRFYAIGMPIVFIWAYWVTREPKW